MDHKDSWKNSTDIFQKQLELNLSHLVLPVSSPDFPLHWINMIKLLRRGLEILDIKKVLDIGCGCGAGRELLHRSFPHIEYTGIDYSEKAIEISRLAWGGDYQVKDLWEMTPKDVAGYDLIYSDALLDILPNGDEALIHMMTLGAPAMLLNRVQNGDDKNHHSVYMAYDILPTYSYYFNRGEMLEKFKRSGYDHYMEMRKDLFSTFFLWRGSK